MKRKKIKNKNKRVKDKIQKEQIIKRNKMMNVMKMILNKMNKKSKIKNLHIIIRNQ